MRSLGLGGARVIPLGGKLQVSNFGFSGEDGVRLFPKEPGGMRIQWDAIAGKRLGDQEPD